MSAGAIAANF